jgi:hypothetical protein
MPRRRIGKRCFRGTTTTGNTYVRGSTSISRPPRRNAPGGPRKEQPQIFRQSPLGYSPRGDFPRPRGRGRHSVSRCIQSGTDGMLFLSTLYRSTSGKVYHGAGIIPDIEQRPRIVVPIKSLLRNYQFRKHLQTASGFRMTKI